MSRKELAEMVLTGLMQSDQAAADPRDLAARAYALVDALGEEQDIRRAPTSIRSAAERWAVQMLNSPGWMDPKRIAGRAYDLALAMHEEELKRRHGGQ